MLGSLGQRLLPEAFLSYFAHAVLGNRDFGTSPNEWLDVEAFSGGNHPSFVRHGELSV